MRVVGRQNWPRGDLLRLRSRSVRAPRRAGATIGAVMGTLAAMVPTGYQDIGEGAGLFGGAFFGILGVTACAPVWLTYLVCAEVAGDDERGIVQSLYLVAADLVPIRVGALLAAARSWTLVIGYGAIAGGLVGLGDGIRAGDAAGVDLLSVRGAVLALVVPTYVMLMSAALCALIRRALSVMLTVMGAALASFLLVPMANETGSVAALSLLPTSPLLSLAGQQTLGRFAMDLSPAVALTVALFWSTAAAIVIVQVWGRPRKRAQAPRATAAEPRGNTA